MGYLYHRVADTDGATFDAYREKFFVPRVPDYDFSHSSSRFGHGILLCLFIYRRKDRRGLEYVFVSLECHRKPWVYLNDSDLDLIPDKNAQFLGIRVIDNIGLSYLKQHPFDAIVFALVND